MPSVTDFLARGRVSEKRERGVVFKPTGTNYELMLETAAPYDGPLNEPLEAILRATARKVYTVAAGGNFVAPIFGPPRIIQGRVKSIDGNQMVVRAGTNFLIELPARDSAIDLNNGSVAVGAMVNVAALPGATFELLRAGSACAAEPASAD
jgi:hypothetical protein